MAIRWKLLALLVWLVGGSLFTSPADAVEYSFITFDVPGGIDTEILGLNNVGEFVGVYGAATTGFLYSRGVVSTVAFPGADVTVPYGINDSGDITGYYIAGGVTHGFVRVRDVYTSFDVPTATQTFGRGINNRREIVGQYTTDTNPNRGFVRLGDTFTTIDSPIGGEITAYGINDAGDIVGYIGVSGSVQTFRLVRGNMELIRFQNNVATYGLGINNAGDIVGVTCEVICDAAGNTIYVLSGDTFSFVAPPGIFGDAHGINDHGQLAGFYFDAGGRHGFIATPHGSIRSPAH